LRIVPLVLAVQPGSHGWHSTPDRAYPLAPNGTDDFDTRRPDVAASLYWQLAVLARVHSIAVAYRGEQDQAHAHHPSWRAAAEATVLPTGIVAPTWEVFQDTGSWYHNAADGTFDFANADHRRRCIEHIILPVLRSFDERRPTSSVNPCRWTRLRDGRVPMTLWSIVPGPQPDWRGGDGPPAFDNQAAAHLLLQEANAAVRAEHGFELAWSVDQSWAQYDPTGDYWLVNKWFEPTQANYSVRDYRGRRPASSSLSSAIRNTRRSRTVGSNGTAAGRSATRSTRASTPAAR
jgi:hypothetical protein